MTEQDMTPETLAIDRAARISLRATTGDPNEDLTGWLLGALQRWWMAHAAQFSNPGVCMAFCDAVEDALPQLGRDLRSQAMVRGFISAIRQGPGDGSATARGLVVLLWLDPEATPVSCHIAEWDAVVESTSGEDSWAVADYLLILLRQALSLIGDPATNEASREDVVAAVVTGLAQVAYLREKSDDLWLALGDIASINHGDSWLARVARMHWAIEVLEAILDLPRNGGSLGSR